MKLIFSTLIGLFIGLTSFGQSEELDALKILFADANYVKLIDQSKKYAEKDKTKKDPWVYLWMAKGYYKLSVSGEATEEFKNAFKDGIGALGKMIKLDTDGSCQAENESFVNDFTNACVERIMNDVGAGDYRKAFGWNIKYIKISPNPAGSQYMDGACKFRNGDKGGANTAWKLAETLLKDVKSIDDWLEADKNLLKFGVIQTVECYITGRQMDKAKELLNKMAPWFEDDEEFKAEYDKVVN